MHIVVCAKQVPNPEVSAIVFRIDPNTHRPAEAPGLSLVMSPYDEQCFEAALRIREASEDEVKITALCLGPESAKDLFKQAFSWEADEGIFLCDTAFEEGDGHTTALALAAAVRKLGGVDLILAGRQAADVDTGVVGFLLGEELDVPVLPCASEIAVESGVVRIERVLDDGFETVEVDLPALVTVSNEYGEPRKPSLRQVMRASRKRPTTWGLAELGLETSQLGASGARLLVEDVYVPENDRSCEILEGETPVELVGALVERLRALRVLE